MAVSANILDTIMNMTPQEAAAWWQNAPDELKRMYQQAMYGQNHPAYAEGGGFPKQDAPSGIQTYPKAPTSNQNLNSPLDVTAFPGGSSAGPGGGYGFSGSIEDVLKNAPPGYYPDFTTGKYVPMGSTSSAATLPGGAIAPWAGGATAPTAANGINTVNPLNAASAPQYAAPTTPPGSSGEWDAQKWLSGLGINVAPDQVAEAFKKLLASDPFQGGTGGLGADGKPVLPSGGAAPPNDLLPGGIDPAFLAEWQKSFKAAPTGDFTQEELDAFLGWKSNPVDPATGLPRPVPLKDANGMTGAQRAALAEAQIAAQQQAGWSKMIADQQAMKMPFSYKGGFIPAGGGGSGGGGGGVAPITNLPGFGETATGGTTDPAAATPTTPAAGGTAAPTITPIPLPPAPQYGGGASGGQTGGAGAGAGAGATTGGGTTMPDWLAPFLAQNGGSVLPPELLQSLGLNPQTGLPQYPASPGTTPGGTTGTGTAAGGAGGGAAQVPGVTLPAAPNLPTPTLNFPDIPAFQNNIPGYDPNSLGDLWNQISGGGTGGTAGTGGAGGTAGGGLFPGQTGTAGGATGSNALLDQLMGNYQQQQDAANQANETRYQDILKGYGDRSNTALEMLANLGLTERNQIKEAYEKTRGATEQSLTSRGLANTTVMPSVLRGVDNDYTRSMGELQQRINSTGLGVYTGTTGDTLGFMERRTDAAPDSSFLASLASGLGEAGYGANGATSSLGATSTPASGGGGSVSSPGAVPPRPDASGAGQSLAQSGTPLAAQGQSWMSAGQSQSAPTATGDWWSGPNPAANNQISNSPENNPYGNMQSGQSQIASMQSQMAPMQSQFAPTQPTGSGPVGGWSGTGYDQNLAGQQNQANMMMELNNMGVGQYHPSNTADIYKKYGMENEALKQLNAANAAYALPWQ